jgi:hypothetical protein
VVVVVNRDASLFCRAPGSGLVARHGDVARLDYPDSAVQRTEQRGAGRAERTPRHSKSGHGRSTCKSRPASGRLHKEKTVPTLLRHETPVVNERHDRQHIGPAYVPGTVWSTASSQTAKFRSRRRACPLIPANYHAPLALAVSPRPISRTTTSTPERRASAQHRQPG